VQYELNGGHSRCRSCAGRSPERDVDVVRYGAKLARVAGWLARQVKLPLRGSAIGARITGPAPFAGPFRVEQPKVTVEEWGR